MTARVYDLGILGGGAAGLTAAAGAAQLGARTLLIEKSGRLGGDCLHTGCVPSKTLLHAARVWALAGRTSAFGLPDLERPPVDMGRVMDRVGRVVARIQEHDSPERLCRLGVEVRFGTARFVDPHTVELEGARLSVRAWIVATGSRPALPPVEGLGRTPHWTNETVFTQRRLPERLLVLGGGPVGLELAQAFGRLGSRVTVVEFLDQVLPAEDPDMARIVQERLEAEGVDIRTSTRAVRAEPAGQGVRLVVEASGGGREALEADALLVATGRRPNVEGLGLEAAGVAYSARGIPVNARMRTNVRHIYACGDVNGRFPFTHVAGYEAGIAVANAVMRLPRRADYTRIPWCTYTDPELASVGLNEKRAREQGVAYRVLEERFGDNDRAVAEDEAGGKIKVLVSGGRILGCQIAGPRAGELVHEWVAALAGGVRLSTLAGAVHAYPTLSEISKRAATAPYAEKLFGARTRGVLRFLFHLKGRGCSPPEGEA